MTWFALPPPVELGEGWSLRFLTAAEMLECREEGEAMAKEERDKALWANAALLSRTLLKEGGPAFENGADVLANLTVGQIDGLTRRWWAQDSFDQQPHQEELTDREVSENEQFDMARFLELGGTAGEPYQGPVWESSPSVRASATPELWPQREAPSAEALTEAWSAYGGPYETRELAAPLKRSGAVLEEAWERPLKELIEGEPMELSPRKRAVEEIVEMSPKRQTAEEIVDLAFKKRTVDEITELARRKQAEEEITKSSPRKRIEEEKIPQEEHRTVTVLLPENVQRSEGPTIEDLDRAVERDARRYGGGFSLL